MTDQKKAYLFAILAILFWSTIATAFKLTLEHIFFLPALFYASAVSTFIYLIILLSQNKFGQLTRLNKSAVLQGSFRGFLNPFLYYLVLLKAYSLLKAQEAGTLNYIWPITLVLLSIPLLKQKISWVSILAVFISFFGIVVISSEGRVMDLSFREPFGVILAVGSSVFWALYWILNVKDKTDEVIKMFLNFSFGTIYIFIAILLFSDFSPVSVKGLLGSLYIGIFEMGITYFLWLMAMKNSENTAKIGNLVYLSPFISLIIIHFVLNEKILLSTFIGLVFIVSGIIIQYIEGKKKKRLSSS
ncbi:MAG: DMT family transporter [Bacteroidales bacterium]